MKTQTSLKTIHISLWIAQGLLAGMFLLAGIMKIFLPYAKLVHIMPWAVQVPWDLLRFIGVAECLGAIGSLLPSISHIRTYITPIAAGGLTMVQAFAIIFHGSRGEISMIWLNFILIALSFFIAIGRGFIAPIKSRDDINMQYDPSH